MDNTRGDAEFFGHAIEVYYRLPTYARAVGRSRGNPGLQFHEADAALLYHPLLVPVVERVQVVDLQNIEEALVDFRLERQCLGSGLSANSQCE